jgi:hypothetical protein
MYTMFNERSKEQTLEGERFDWVVLQVTDSSIKRRRSKGISLNSH